MNLPLPGLRDVRVVVAGDLMLDRYWHGATQRISPEAPVPVVRVDDAEERPGGAANVALNVAALGGAAQVIGPTGSDEAADRLAQLLEAAGVGQRFHRIPGADTITKLRVISRHQQLIRLDFERGFPGFDRAAMLALLEPVLTDTAVVVLSDYAKGALPDPAGLIDAARRAGRPVLVDPKGADYRRYRGATLLTPNLAEFEAVVGPCADGDEIARRAAMVAAELELEALLVTRGEAGMTLAPREGAPVHLPTRAREVFDVTGAGDTVIATLAAALGAGVDLADAAALANLAAGVVVGKLGTATVTPAELEAAMGGAGGQAAGAGVVDEPGLLAAVRQARAAGERIVMTNGCFDLLHAGHVDYLQRARRRGERLVVAVNDDASVARLKGAERPVTPLEQRMAVLAGLDAVDWVVPFSEDTPARLIEAVLPDLLVKGGDYRPEQIAGHDAVVAAGGAVEVLPLLAGASTTGLIARIRGRG
ncbi:bifunctional D-glycero-beta-D-manno-heptose-7-phosphate kinase/D-glycero-beta-D-manno-heptose 1-phosphate adenylyltransferase HldE [Halorhodospira sp. 9621]|uniref:bifunctional D-glycero-beta-D-manno-heptose-7-phosphate kinase/D-glycero-beta-D-manno-heptose 1-phosphate adenylyltransferase HldE n=1 Tax=Halorhodospira sp. 9621 TaxID=2899135 RepID=UPI001EE81040|nr:bifunctional D-glycero-beta-D-manno-heptose-7-phosphate kinase/D-glycero-beta-D-manno-heptose 1-phosphate adenylyltransferase HldE [Halorhodospira sp. 9621]MCG5532489.1 bifunctional D-glycero-beta-D-manno-heptose-7-phosphate kinase/D-glycero-beta-D-manno-heptose 1-phosphate adenylyltransferase HldE [Halorhodospira sp. 9621]